jgi:hypothetical protein
MDQNYIMFQGNSWTIVLESAQGKDFYCKTADI